MPQDNIDVMSAAALKAFGVERAAYAIGVFDGVHLGHCKIFEQLKKAAAENNAEPVVVTFSPHPREVLTPKTPPKLLMTLEKRIELIHHQGIRFVVVMPFNRQLAVKSPSDFIRDSLMTNSPEICAITVGENWRFGHNGAGDCSFLTVFAKENNFFFESVPMLSLDGKIVCSSSIRNLIAGGDLEEAAKMLGHNCSLYGAVQRGYGQATSELKCPTANISISAGILPPCGVYAGMVEFNQKLYPAAVNIGHSPTFNRLGDFEVRVEAHLLDFSGSLYGENIELKLLGWIREERSFASIEELKQQITTDISVIDEYCRLFNNKS